MKEKMDKNSIDALIGYRCQRSDEAIQEAELLCQEGFYNCRSKPTILCLLLCNLSALSQR